MKLVERCQNVCVVIRALQFRGRNKRQCGVAGMALATAADAGISSLAVVADGVKDQSRCDGKEVAAIFKVRSLLEQLENGFIGDSGGAFRQRVERLIELLPHPLGRDPAQIGICQFNQPRKRARSAPVDVVERPGEIARLTSRRSIFRGTGCRFICHGCPRSAIDFIHCNEMATICQVCVMGVGLRFLVWWWQAEGPTPEQGNTMTAIESATKSLTVAALPSLNGPNWREVVDVAARFVRMFTGGPEPLRGSTFTNGRRCIAVLDAEDVFRTLGQQSQTFGNGTRLNLQGLQAAIENCFGAAECNFAPAGEESSNLMLRMKVHAAGWRWMERAAGDDSPTRLAVNCIRRRLLTVHSFAHIDPAIVVLVTHDAAYAKLLDTLLDAGVHVVLIGCIGWFPQALYRLTDRPGCQLLDLKADLGTRL